MKNKISYIYLFLIFQIVQAQDYTLGDCIQIAIEGKKTVLSAALNVKSASFGLKASYSSLLPSIQGAAGADRPFFPEQEILQDFFEERRSKEKILLARSPHWKNNLYSCLAGFCEYNESKKILVSDGRNLVIQNFNSDQYYIYPIEKTAFNLILDKNFLLNKIKNLDERVINDKYINYSFNENENEINIFFSKKNNLLVGWQLLDVYQNLSITFISILNINQKLNKRIFYLPSQN